MAKQTFTTGQVLTAAQMTSLQQTAMGGGSATAKTASYVLVAADAGTTVAMNAAGSTTITVNTGLFAAGDTVFIQNLGAGACTVTAGTATVATAGSLILPQNDAGILYFTATGASIFYDYIQAGAVSPLTTKGDIYGFSTLDARIPIGTNNQVLTADSAQALGLKWATPAGGGKVLQVVTATTSTAVTVSTTTFTDTGVTATITPTLATSKILVLANQAYTSARSDSVTGMGLKLQRAGTDIWIGNPGVEAFNLQINTVTLITQNNFMPVMLLDSPSTTSSTIYKLQGRPLYSSSSGSAVYQPGSGTSTITLLEIGA